MGQVAEGLGLLIAEGWGFLKYLKPGGCNYYNDSRGQKGSHGGLTCRELRRWIAEHGAPRGEMVRQPIRLPLEVLQTEEAALEERA